LLAERWRAILAHPVLQLELRRIRRKRWWPGRRFFLFYPALLGATLGYGVMLALSDSWGVRLAAVATGLPVVCLLSVVTSLLALALTWIAPALTATTIARERELGTLDLLRVTLLSERSIVLGKLGACLAWLWPGILTLVLLAPFQLTVLAGGGLFGSSSLVATVMEPASEAAWAWVWLLLTGVAGWVRRWSDLAFHAAVGLFVSALSRSVGVAITTSYGAVLVARVAFWLATSALGFLPLLLMDQAWATDEIAIAVSPVVSLVMSFIEFAGAVLLVWGAIWWLRRT
jgi:hypothetical protein